jgi:predicted Fe-Mo cluster-binding NifX family protein
MGVSQPTFHRLLVSAHQKLTDAVVNGKALRIEGGNIMSTEVPAGPCRWRRGWGCRTKASIGTFADDQNLQPEGGKTMKIAITSADGTLQGKIDERFGRARKIILYDIETREHSVVDNVQNLNAAQGAGIQAAQNVVRSGAGAIISGHFGPKAFQVIQMAGLDVYSATNISVEDAIHQYESGKLIKLANADVVSHW